MLNIVFSISFFSTFVSRTLKPQWLVNDAREFRIVLYFLAANGITLRPHLFRFADACYGLDPIEQPSTQPPAALPCPYGCTGPGSSCVNDQCTCDGSYAAVRINGSPVNNACLDPVIGENQDCELSLGVCTCWHRDSACFLAFTCLVSFYVVQSCVWARRSAQ